MGMKDLLMADILEQQHLRSESRKLASMISMTISIVCDQIKTWME